MENNSINIGAGWSRISKKGAPYVSVGLEIKEIWKAVGIDPELMPPDLPERIFVSLFTNPNKEKEKHPDFNLVFFPKD